MNKTKRLSWPFYMAIFIGLFYLNLPGLSLAQSNPCAAKNPCAANPCAAKNPCMAKNPCSAKNPCAAVNPCAAKNPCAANPCAPGARGARSTAKAITVRGEIVSINPRSGKLVLRANGSQLDLTLARYSVVRQGPKVKTAKEIKRGDKATVSYVESGRVRTAWYIYLASGASVANPCAANPCAARNPCAAKNPCAANPCAARNPCAAKNPCAANPCAVR